jgi:translation elongation factor EF-1beta
VSEYLPLLVSRRHKASVLTYYFYICVFIFYSRCRNEWFEIVCRDDHRSFEWYCGVEEPVKVLKFHLPDEVKDEANEHKPRRMIHPGSGTSLLPLELRHCFSMSQQVVLDISDVALDEMRSVHGAQNSATAHGHEEHAAIEYVLADILDPPISFEGCSFDAWIDKGFIDAVFAKETQDENRIVAKILFDEAHRLLKSRGGTLLVVTLAEDHSLQLLLDNWRDSNGDGWHSTLHIWELQPVSGDMLPFCFVFVKMEGRTAEDRSFIWHGMDGSSVVHNLGSEDKSSIFEKIKSKVEITRDGFARQKSAESIPPNVHQLLASIEVKPYDAGVDMQALGLTLTSTAWHAPNDGGLFPLSPRWYPFTDDSNEGSILVKVVPIGFGISKVKLRCIINADHLDALVEAIQEWDGDAIFEGVQSVDVDWNDTVRVSSAGDIFSKIE